MSHYNEYNRLCSAARNGIVLPQTKTIKRATPPPVPDGKRITRDRIEAAEREYRGRKGKSE